MNKKSDYESILSQINQPAFLVQGGIITAANSAAAIHFAEIGTPVEELIISGIEEYRQFYNGNLYLTIHLCGSSYTCVVSSLEDGQLFVLDTEAIKAELQVLSLAAQQLSMPFSELSLLLDQLSDADAAKKAMISQNICRLKRIIGNMADASRYENTEAILHYCNVTAVLEEIMEKAQSLFEQSSIKLSYHISGQPVYTMVNQEMLRRAVYNMLSNAAKFSDGSKSVEVQLKQNKDKLYLTVISQTDQNHPSSNLFKRYLRQPGLEDRKFGLGLGMSLVHAAAAAHNGTVLIQQDKDQQFKITLSLSITKSTDCTVRSPILLPDIYGGNDQALIELSDVLSVDLY